MSNSMDAILTQPLRKIQAALWPLGQAGYILRAGQRTIVIDPYLSDSAVAIDARLKRLFPPPIRPEELKTDVFIITHDHIDHLDPETVGPYRHKDSTVFVAPRLACRKLRELKVPEKRVVRVDSGEEVVVEGVTVKGIYAVPTDPGVIDTTGYQIIFPNGRSAYHTSDTAFSEVMLKAAPKTEVLLTVINGKWGNLGAEQAAALAAHLKPKVAIPGHYDVMAINAENPETFAFFMKQMAPAVPVRILKVMEPFLW